MMKILITGGTGFIGSHLVEQMLAKGHEVRIISKEPNPKNLSNISGNYKIIVGDYFGGIDFDKCTEEIDIVYHLLWTSLPRNTLEDALYDIQTNIEYSLKLLNSCVKNKVSKFVFASSGGTVYGITDNIPCKETDNLNPISNYGLTKVMFEKYLVLYKYQHALNYSILRVSNAYGERQDPAKRQGVISAWCNKIINNQTLEIWGDGSIIRDYIHVDDVVDSLIVASTTQESNIYNVGSGRGYSLIQLLDIFEAILKFKPRVDFKPKHTNDVPFNILDVNLIKSKLGWSPMVSIEEGILRTYNFLKLNRK